MNTDQKIMATISAISEKLDVIQEHMAWVIKPDQRFRIGQRVEWSAKAHRAGFPMRKKCKRGTVKAMNLFSIVVLLDGQRKPSTYHHAFFNPVSGPNLF